MTRLPRESEHIWRKSGFRQNTQEISKKTKKLRDFALVIVDKW